MKGGLAVAAMVAALALTGCIEKKPSEANRLKALISSKSKLVVLHSFPEQSMSIQAPPDEAPGEYGIRTVYKPGSINVEPITAREVSSGTIERGCALNIRTTSYNILSATDPKGTEHFEEAGVYLDQHEMQDLEKSLDFMESSRSDWSKAPPKVRTVIAYSSSDGLDMSLLFQLEGDPQYQIRIRDARIQLKPDQEQSLRRVLKGAANVIADDK